VFVSQAHTFSQQARLSITLAWVAGYTNIVAVIVLGTVISHVSGTASNLGRDVVDGVRGVPNAWDLAGFALLLLVSFLLGASASGFCSELGRRRGWQSIYVLPMALETILLGLFAIGLEVYEPSELTSGPRHLLLSGVACAAMGLQNATITRISSGVVRTTHVTGVLTDLGLELVQFFWWLRDRQRHASFRTHRVHRHPTALRLALLISIVGSFALGAALGTLVHDAAPSYVMVLPVLFMIWLIYRDLVVPIVAIRESELFEAGGGLELPDGMSVFHLRQEGGRRGRAARRHRMPNFLAWLDRLPPETSVVILDLGDVSRLDAASASELRTVLKRVHAAGRRMVISGLSRDQLVQLREGDTSEALDVVSVCPDLELAIARGLVMLEESASAS
jgi:uncharacterized membrane protein YoaK (UPF0700 family)